jgi:hypothetical protein
MKYKNYIYTITLIALMAMFAACTKQKTEETLINESGKLQDTTEKLSSVSGENIANELNRDSILEIQHKTDSLKAVKEQKKRTADSLKAAKENEVKLIAYYFHPTARCVTCRNIEAYAIEAIEKWKEENETPIAWKELNIEDSVNEHYVKEYELQFSSLVVAKFTGGKKTNWKNLEDTWKLVNDKKAFIKYVDSELDNFITKQK